MKILALDCSTEACSAALWSDGKVIAEEFELAAREHTQRLLPMVDKLLANTATILSGIDAIAFGRGPGSFTGLRICLGAVQGLAYGADLPVVPVSTLAALAQSAVLKANCATAADTRLISALDARMDEIYWAVYRVVQGLVVREGSERLTKPEQLIIEGSSCVSGYWAVGTGWRYAERIAVADQVTQIDDSLLPGASAVALLAAANYQQGNYCRADQALPTYLRDEVAWQKQPF